jgi:hypothetical protein
VPEAMEVSNTKRDAYQRSIWQKPNKVEFPDGSL